MTHAKKLGVVQRSFPFRSLLELFNYRYLIYDYNRTMYEPTFEANEIDVDKMSMCNKVHLQSNSKFCWSRDEVSSSTKDTQT